MKPNPEDVIRALPCWRGRPDIEPLAGGLSNAAFKVRDPSGVYVARLGEDFPFHHVSRAREAAAARAAHEAGIGPRVLYAEGGAMVCDFIDGRVFTSADFRARLDDCVALLRRCHADMRRLVRAAASAFWVFHVVRDYAGTLRADGGAIVAMLPRLLAVADELEDAQVPLPIIFGHHDLLPGNVIDDSERLWLIDWEYSGFGTPMFDLANLADNGGYGDALGVRLLETYFGRTPDVATQRAFAAMKAASALREALWAEVSHIHLRASGVDYRQYAAECSAKFETAYAAFRERFA
jgi:thiamine kinase-like enzyme